MNKFLTKVAKIFLGLSMAAGVGFTVASNREVARVDAAANTYISLGTGSTTTGRTTWTADTNKVTVTLNQAESGSWNGNTAFSTSKDSTVRFYVGEVFAIVPAAGYKITGVKITNSTNSSYYGGNYVANTVWSDTTKKISSSDTTNLTLTNCSSTTSGQVSTIESKQTSGVSGIYISTSKQSRPSKFEVKYTAEAVTHTVTVNVNNSSYGTVSQSSVTSVANNASISASGSTLTVGTTNVTASPKSSTDQYNFAFNNWTGIPAGGKVTGNITVTANFTATTRTYNVTNSVSNASFTGASTVSYGTAYSGTFTANSGYILPASLTSVTIKGTATNNYSYNSTTGAFSIAAQYVTGAIVINGTCPASGNSYSISTTVTNGSYSGDTSITDNGGVASVTIAPTGDYKLPASVSVSGASHTYNDDTGVISLSNATGNVTISAAMVALTEYSITVDETNGSHTGASTIKESRTASLTFTPALGYGQPSSVTVSGATSSWTRGTGVLSLSNPTGNVTVKYTAVGNELDSISISANSGNYTLGDNFVMPTVTAKYTVNADADVTSSASYSGYDPYTTGSQPVTISYTEGGITKTQSYTATVGAASVTTTTTWELTNLSDLTSSDEFVIARTSSTTVALPSDGGAAKPTVSSVTISNNKITSTVTDSILWNVTGNASDGYVFNPKGDSTKWLYLLPDSNDGVRIGNGNSAANKHFTLEQGYLYSTETTYPRMIGVYNNADWRCYKLTSGGEPGSNIADQTFGFFKKVVTQSGSADLIRITAEYTGGAKYVGNTVSVSDFLIKKQYNTGDTLTTLTSEEMATVTIVSGGTLTGEDNTVVLRYVEGGIPQTASVSVSAIEVTAELQSVTLVQDSQTVKKNYVFVSGLQWDFTGLSVAIDYDVDDYDLSFDLATLVQNEEATISPAAPSVGDTSFTVSYRFNDEMDISSATVSGITVREDYVTSMSWTGTTASHFKAFSGGQLTAAQVGAWHVTPTFAGAGVGSELSFNQYTLKVGSKVISSLPYTWTSEDDGQELSITYGKDVDGNDFVKTNNTAVANICASINAIDHTETITPASEEVVNAYVRIGSTAEITSGGKYLIVYEGDSTHTSVAFDGSLSTLDATSNGQSVSISDNRIAIPANDNFYFTITEDDDVYSIVTADGSNVGHNGTKNGMDCSNSTNYISFDEDGYATITGSGGLNLRYNYASDQLRFRYYTSTQQQVAIYKYINETIHHDAVTETTHYANDMEHFDAQKKVVEFAKFMNTTMNGSNVCSGTFANLESAWGDVAGKYDELFGADTTLSETELAWAKNMLKYATAAWGSDAEAACVEKAMKTYEHCTSKYELTPFMDGVRSAGAKQVSPLVNIIGENTNTVAIIVIISMVSVTAIGGYFFLRKRNENI